MYSPTQAGVEARPAGEEHDPLHRAQLGRAHLQAAEMAVAVVVDHAPAEGIADGLRLLVDLLEHEVVEAAFSICSRSQVTSSTFLLIASFSSVLVEYAVRA